MILILTKFHDKTIVIVTFIAVYVTLLLLYIFNNQGVIASHEPAHELEFTWTLYPAIILGGIAIPSLRILYLIDDVTHPNLTLKVIGHQWYWSYGIDAKEFDSYIINDVDLPVGAPRLLEVDNRVVAPTGLDIRLLVSSADVLHSWAIPSLGVKVDAVPGRLNQYNIVPMLPGIYYGQCSEICGANHSFIPISLERVSIRDWLNWRIRF